jgi:hypothetical protein
VAFEKQIGKEAYSKPKLSQRNVEQAKLFLVGHAWIGDQGARVLLELLFPIADGCREQV